MCGIVDESIRELRGSSDRRVARRWSLHAALARVF
jgi:hypothetical protein